MSGQFCGTHFLPMSGVEACQEIKYMSFACLFETSQFRLWLWGVCTPGHWLLSFFWMGSSVSSTMVFVSARNCHWPLCRTLAISSLWSFEEPKYTWSAGVWCHSHSSALLDCIGRGQNHQQSQPCIPRSCSVVSFLHLYWNLCISSKEWSRWVALCFPLLPCREAGLGGWVGFLGFDLPPMTAHDTSQHHPQFNCCMDLTWHI